MQLLFILFGLITIAGAIGMVTSHNIVHSAFYLVLCFIGMALLYFALEAPFLGAVQLMVYSGAVAILIIMAIMMIRRSSMDRSAKTVSLFKRVVSALLAGTLFVLLGAGITLTPLPAGRMGVPVEAEDLAGLLLGDFVIPFELVAVLLLAALIGALLLARGGEES